ncbi:MAG: LysR family transcriptional regulator [Myxococcota bacterium]
MSIEKFRRFDLNLLLLLHVLLEERSVTASARRLGLSQGAVSRSLGRLRDQLEDDLLVRVGGAMVPTPRAEAMKAPLEQLLHGLGLLFEPEEEIHPETLAKEFAIGSDGYPFSMVLPMLVAKLQHTAPQVSLRVERLRRDSAQRLGVGELDLVVAPEFPALAGVVWTKVREERFCTVARSGHPRVQGPLTLDEFVRESHVTVSPHPAGLGEDVDRVLAQLERTRRTAVSVPSVSEALDLVLHSDHIATVPESAAAGRPKLQWFPPPVALTATRIRIGWHERMRRDPSHRWFRRVLVDALSLEHLAPNDTP